MADGIRLNTLTHWLKRHGMVIAIIAVTLVLALPTLTYPLGRDQGEFATTAVAILDGRVPYAEIWNPKPPAVFYVYALAMSLFGRTAVALRLIDFFIVPPLLLALVWLGTRVSGQRAVGLWAALIFPVFYFTETFWTLTQNDGIAALPMTLALVCTLKAAEAGGRYRWRWALAAGMLSAVVLWFKYPFVIVVAALVVIYVGARRGRSERAAVLGFVGGGLLVGGGGLLHLLMRGGLSAWVESIRVTAGYTALGAGDLDTLLTTALGFRWAHWGLLLVLAGAFAAATVIDTAAKRTPENKTSWWVVWVWLLAASAAMLVQLRGYDYHWLPMLPPLSLLAAGSVTWVLRWFDRCPVPTKASHFLSYALTPPPSRQGDPPQNRGGERGVGLAMTNRTPPQMQQLESLRIAWFDQKHNITPKKILTIMLALTFIAMLINGVWRPTLPYLTGREDRATYYQRFQAGEFIAAESQQVIAFLRARVTPGDSLYIWGFRPEVYYLTGLKPPTRFIFQFPLVGDWYPPRWREENVEILWAALPPYVLVLKVDYMPWVTGEDADSHELLQAYTALNDWLIYNYEQETQIGNFLIWRRTRNP